MNLVELHATTVSCDLIILGNALGVTVWCSSTLLAHAHLHNVLHSPSYWVSWFSPEHTLTQFVVYSGYYYVLTLIFIGAGVYNLTSTGWLKSLHICCHEFIPHAPGGPSLIQNEDSSESEESVSRAIWNCDHLCVVCLTTAKFS